MYHINNEGKVLPCNAKVRACPYGSSRHASTQGELYYRIMKYEGQGEPSYYATSELQRIGRLKSLYSASPDIESSKAPISTIVATLSMAIEELEETDPSTLDDKWAGVFKEGAEEVYKTLNWGYSIQSFVPADIRRAGERLFMERNDGQYTEEAMVTENRAGYRQKEKLESMKPIFDNYREFNKTRLTDDNKEASIKWMKRDFYQFSHDMNTSKLITQPVFYGNVDEAKRQIKEMDNEELLASFDDYLVTDNEILENVKLANYFVYSNRKDLTPLANNKLREWYKRNHEIFKNWERGSAKRVLLAMELGSELDRRGIRRQDSSVLT